MDYEIVELVPFSGGEAKIYSVIPEGKEETLFDNFIKDYKDIFRGEVKDILGTLHEIGHTTGARYSYFKHHEGKKGDYVCALYDCPDKNLRLYCIRFSSCIVILGDGGQKKKEIIKWQQDKRLSKAAMEMIKYANDILKRLDSKNGDLRISKDGMELEGNLNNYDNDYNE